MRAIEADGCKVFFSSAVALGDDAYRTVGTSRAVALASTAPDARAGPSDASTPAPSGAGAGVAREVGDGAYLDGLGRPAPRGGRPAGVEAMRDRARMAR